MNESGLSIDNDVFREMFKVLSSRQSSWFIWCV